MSTYWIMMDGKRVGTLETEFPLNTIQKSKQLGVFAEAQGASMRGMSLREVKNV